MKVIQIVPKMNLGGVERGVLDVAKYFGPEQVIVISGGGKLVSQLQKNNIPHYQLNTYSKSPLNLLNIIKLRQILVKENPTIVHARSRVPGWLSFFATRNSNSHFITTAHGLYRKHFSSEVMGWGELVICPSKTVAQHMIENFGVPKSKIRIVPRWVDIEQFSFIPPQDKKNNFNFLMMGRLSPSKGYEYAIEALRKAINKNPRLRLNIMGWGKKNYRKKLERMVYQQGLTNHVNFFDARHNISRIMAKCYALIMPSIIEEAFGRVIIEAFAAGLPVIASKVGAVSEIIEDKKNGLLVPPADVDAFAEAMLFLIDNPEFAQQLALQARKKVEQNYTKKKCLELLDMVYKEAEQLERILVCKISSLGDLILIIPSLKAIRDNFPKAHITLLTHHNYSSLFSGCPYIDEIIFVDNNFKNPKKFLKMAQRLCRNAYTWFIDLQNNRFSHLMAFFSFPRKSVGYKRKLGFLLTNFIPYIKSEKINPLASQEKILKRLGISLKNYNLFFWPRGKRIFPFLNSQSYPKIGINFSASKRWPTKNWPVAYIEDLVGRLIKIYPNSQILFLGTSELESLGEQIASKYNNTINLCGKTNLNDLIDLLAYLDVFLVQDTATLHLAVALGIQTIALFGPTDPSRHVVRNSNLKLIYHKLSCSFCYRRKCKEHRCMKLITPEQVFSLMREIIDKNNKK